MNQTWMFTLSTGMLVLVGHSSEYIECHLLMLPTFFFSYAAYPGYLLLEYGMSYNRLNRQFLQTLCKLQVGLLLMMGVKNRRHRSSRQIIHHFNNILGTTADCFVQIPSSQSQVALAFCFVTHQFQEQHLRIFLVSYISFHADELACFLI